MEKTQTGFTLTEVLMVVAIVAIMLSIGLPSYKYITNAYRMSAEINSLVGDLMYARAEAIKEGQPVALCVSSDGQTCSGATTWASGWVVFPDPTGGGSADVPGSILHVQAAFTGATPDTFNPSNPISSIIFNREGFAVGSPNAAAVFGATQFTLHDPTANANWTRCLFINAQGMIQTDTAKNPTAGLAACN